MSNLLKFNSCPREFSRGLAYRLWFASEARRVNCNALFIAAPLCGALLGILFMLAVVGLTP